MEFDKKASEEALAGVYGEELTVEVKKFIENYPKLYEVVLGLVDAVASHEQILGSHEWKLETLRLLVQRGLEEDGIDVSPPLSLLKPEEIN